MKNKAQSKHIAFIFSLLLLVWPVLRVWGEEGVTAVLTPTQTSLAVGDVVQLVLSVTYPAGYRALPVQPDQQWGDFEVRALSPMEVRRNDDGTETSTQTIEVTLWGPGEYATPPLTITVADAAGNVQEVTADPITLTVKSVLVEGDTELRDIKPQAGLPVPPVWPWVLAAVLAAVAAGFLLSWLWRWWRARRPEEAVAPAPDLRPAYQIALDELARIEQLDLPAQGQFKEHYTHVADVLRRYLEAEFRVPALDRTTGEIRRAIRKLLLDPQAKTELVNLLADADLVKFAKFRPTQAEAEALPQQAREWVLAVRPRPASPSSDGGKPALTEAAA
ncbi:MAG: hypothetical protein ACE5E7_01980 [Anaerolineae bacterium]